VSLDDAAELFLPVTRGAARTGPVEVPGVEGAAPVEPRRLDLPAPGRLDVGAGPVVVVDDRLGSARSTGVGVEVVDPAGSGLLAVSSPLVFRVDDPSSGLVTVSYSAFADVGGWGFWDRVVVRMFADCVAERPDDVLCSTPVELAPELVSRDLQAEELSFRVDGLAELVESSRVELAARESEFDWEIPKLDAAAQAAALDRNRLAAESSVSGLAVAPSSGSVLAQPLGGGVILAMSSGWSGVESGDLGAVPRPQLGDWSSSPGSGNFGWSFPIPLPDVAGSLVPDLRLTYASSAVDRMTLNENGQAPEAGLGWDFPIGSIRRNYWSCADDNAASAPAASLCWQSDNATIVLNGRSSELVKVASYGTEVDEWRLKDDPGWNVYRYWGSQGAEPSGAPLYDDDNGEYWVVATPDGTRYFFGRYNKDYNSTLTVPVFGDDPGEPCGNTYGGFCWQAYEWRLDAITDAQGNPSSAAGNWVTFSYDGKANWYNANGTNLKYDRAARLSRIEYGKTTPAPSSAAAVAIHFPIVLRTDGAGTQYWPTSLYCGSSGSCPNSSPTFWEDTRLAKIEINVQNPSSTGYKLIDRYTLNHEWKRDPAETLDRMLLMSIDYDPFGDEGVALPTRRTEFDYAALQNRAIDDAATHGLTPLNLYRLNRISDLRMSSRLNVTYGQQRPCQASQLVHPPQVPSPLWSANINDCFPTWVSNSSGSAFNIFNKWLVRTVSESALAPDSVPVLSNYYYDRGDNAVTEAGAGWAKEDFAWVPSSQQSWSGWRGYVDATVIVGVAAEERQRTDYQVHRGLGGLLPGTGATDYEEFAGRVYSVWQSESTDGSYDPAQSTRTDYQRLSSGNGSYFVNPQKVHTYRNLWSGAQWHSLVTQTVSNRQVTTVVNEPNVNDPSLDTCTAYRNLSYASYLYGARYVTGSSEIRTYGSADCATNQVGRTVLYYDGEAYNAAFDRDTRRNVTRRRFYDNLSVSSSETASYDSYGRITQATDQRGTVTSMAFTTSEGFTTGVTTTLDPTGLNQQSSVVISRGRGNVDVSTDVNGVVTTYDYDRLGRVTRAKTAGTSGGETKLTYTEDPNGSGFARVWTQRLHDGSTYVDTYQFYDGLGRLRQTFADDDPATNFNGYGSFTGTTVTAVNYDSAGRVEYQTEPFYDTSTGTTALSIPDLFSIELAYAPDYDGLGRVIASRRVNNGVTTATSLTTIDPDRVDTTDMAGDTTTTTYDPRGLVASITDGATTPVYGYDRLGRLMSVTDGSGRTDVSYDYTYWNGTNSGNPSWLGRQYSTTDTDRGTTRFESDANGNLVRTLDANANKIRTSYDRANRPVRRWDENVGSGIGNGRLADWLYGTAGMEGLLDREISYTDQGTFERRVLSRDSAGRPTSVRWDIPTIAGFSSFYDFGFSYNADGSLKTRAYPAGSGLSAETVNYSYDNAGRLDTVIGDGTYASDTYLAATAYDWLGRTLLRVHGQGANTINRIFLYDTGTGFLSSLGLNTSSGQAAPNQTYTLQSETYTRAADGTLTGITRGAGTILESTECFANDNAGRITNNWYATGANCYTGTTRKVDGYDNEYDYLSTSTLANVNDLTTPSGVNDTTYIYGTTSPSNADHQAEAIQIGGVTQDTFTYRANGDLKTHNTGTTNRTYNYDTLNQLSSVTIGTDTTSFAYNPSGQRLYTEEPDGTIRIYLDDTEVALAQGWLPAMTRQYSTGSVQVATRNSLLTDLQYTFGNQQGSSAAVVDDNPSTTAAVPAWQLRQYTPFGDTRVNWQLNNPQLQGTNQRFLNQYHDVTTDLAYLNARYYNPKTRLFTQPDPLRQEMRPQATNAYGYALNNPTNRADPTGLEVCDTDTGACWDDYEDFEFGGLRSKCRCEGSGRYDPETELIYYAGLLGWERGKISAANGGARFDPRFDAEYGEGLKVYTYSGETGYGCTDDCFSLDLSSEIVKAADAWNVVAPYIGVAASGLCMASGGTNVAACATSILVDVTTTALNLAAASTCELDGCSDDYLRNATLAFVGGAVGPLGGDVGRTAAFYVDGFSATGATQDIVTDLGWREDRAG
jgi:RHS repeat-associated protein